MLELLSADGPHADRSVLMDVIDFAPNLFRGVILNQKYQRQQLEEKTPGKHHEMFQRKIKVWRCDDLPEEENRKETQVQLLFRNKRTIFSQSPSDKGCPTMV